MTASTKTIVLGDEADESLRAALKQVLQRLGGRVTSKMPWVPDTEVMTVEVHGHQVQVESDYGLGLSVTGPEDLVNRIAEQVKHAFRP